MPVPSEDELRELLGYRRVAVVGASATPGKDAHHVPAYLVERGYDVVPVNPNREVVLDRPTYPDLASVEGTVELVNVFRPSDEVAGIVEAAVERGDVEALWLQLGIRDDEAVARAEAAGIRVVQDRCIRTTHRRLLG